MKHCKKSQVGDKKKMYKLYTDKQETFECDLFLEGADLKQSSARIVR